MLIVLNGRGEAPAVTYESAAEVASEHVSFTPEGERIKIRIRGFGELLMTAREWNALTVKASLYAMGLLAQPSPYSERGAGG